MACVALTSLISTIELEFLQPTSRVTVSLHDRAPIESFLETLSSWKAILQKESSGASKDLEIEIRDFALKAEDDIEIQIINFFAAKDTEHEEEASQELCQTLQEAAEIAAEISDKEELREIEREVSSNALTSLIRTLEIRAVRVSLRRRRGQLSIIFFVANLSSLQAFLHNKSSEALRDLEIKIRDFALKTEYDTVYQEIQENAFCQAAENAFRQAAENASELLKILTGEKEWYVSEREMASAALTILIAKFKYYFLQTFPTLYACHKATMIYFSANLYSLPVCLLQRRKSNGGGAAAIKIRNFALKAVNDIEIQLKKYVSVKDSEREGEVLQTLRQTLQERAEMAAELLKIIHKEQHEREREMTCGIKSTSLELSSLQVFMQEESSGGSGITKSLKTKIRIFTLKAEYEKASMGLHQALQEATANRADLLSIITKEKREMASDALNTFMTKFYYDFLHSTPVVPLDDEAAMISFFQKLSSLQDYLLQKESSGDATINDLETKIRYFVLIAGGDIETQVKNLVQAKDDTEYQEKASLLNQTLQEAAEIAAEFLMS